MSRRRCLLGICLAAVACGGPQAVPAAQPAASRPGATGPRTPVLVGSPSPDFDLVGLVLDEGHAFWAHRGDLGIVSAPIAGGAAVTLVPGAEQSITSLAEDAGSLYWTAGRRGGTESSQELLGRVNPHTGHFEGLVGRIGKDGKGPTELTSGRFEPGDVGVLGKDVYWVMVRRRDETLVRLPVGTDAPSVVAHGSFAPGSLVVQAGHAYWTDPGAGAGGPAVMTVSLGLGAGPHEEPRRMAPADAATSIRPVRLAADADAVYWTDTGGSEAGGAVMKVPLAGGAPIKLAQGLAGPRGIAVSGGFVYWVEKGTGATNFHDGALRKVSSSGGAPETLAGGLVAPDRLAVSDAHVCWSELDGSVKVVDR